jgi:Methane oxygenase PmoA
MGLRVGGVEVATYVADPDLDIRLAPRPYLHPVRTLGGTTVTDALCFDHPWHLGASVTLSDVGGVNFWGGRTYVRGEGYVWLDDHGRIKHQDQDQGPVPGSSGYIPSLPPETGRGHPVAGAPERMPAPCHVRAHSRLPQNLDWLDGEGRTLLTERRTITAAAAPHGWRLTFDYALTAPAAVSLGSPATHGRTGGAGYGGFFWRGAPGDAHAFTAELDGEREVNGSAEPWVAVTVGDSYTLIFEGLQDDDRWFVRTGEYVGICAALAFERPLTLPAGGTLARRVDVLVADGVLSRADVARAVAPPT